MKPSRKRALVSCLLLSGYGCGASERPRDAGAADAATPRDAAAGGRDAATDARTDVPAIPDPGWVDLPGLPEGCVIQRAEHPEVLFEMSWEPCEGAIRGCEQMTGTAFGEWGQHDGDRGYLHPFMRNRWPGFPQTDPDAVIQIELLSSTEGPAFAAWRHDLRTPGRNCFLLPLAAGEGRGAFGVFWLQSSDYEHRVYADDLERIRFASQPIAVLGHDLIRGGNAFTQLGVSRDMTVAMGLSSFVAIITADETRRLGRIPGLPAAVPQGPLSVVGPDVFWSDWTNYVRIAHASVDSDTELFLEIPEGGDVRDFRTDGVDMAWLQAYYKPNGYDYERIELWTAPYTTDPSTLVPRRVADLQRTTPLSAVVGGGYWAYERLLSDDPRRSQTVLYRLSDGKTSTLDYPEGYAVSAIYVAAHEILARGAPHALFRSSLESLQFE